MQKFIKKEEDIAEALQGLLLDDFSVCGDDASLFAKIQNEISDNTYSVVTPMRYINVFSVLPDDKQPKDGSLVAYLFKAGGIGRILVNLNIGTSKLKLQETEGNKKPVNKNDILVKSLNELGVQRIPESSFARTVNGKKVDNQAAVDELRCNRLLFQINGTIYIVSPFALPTLGQRIELKGRAMQESSPERDLFIAKRLDSSKNIQFIIKKGNGLAKVFMAASENYRPLSMTTIERIYHTFGSEDGLGRMRCEGWEIDHSVSRIRFTFEDYEKAQDLAFLYGLNEEEIPVPGIEIISSDIGDYAFTIRGFWRLKRGYLYSDEVSKKHSGEINEEKVVDEVRHTIFEKYTLLPDRFMELLGIDITPESVIQAANALTAAQEAAQDAKAAGGPKADQAMEELSKVEKRANRQFRDHTKLLNEMIKRIMKEITTTSLQYKKDWTERVTETLNPATPYTAYDLMSIILDTQILTKSDDTVEKMRKSMIRLPYLDYAKFRDAAIAKLALFGTRDEDEEDEVKNSVPDNADEDVEADAVTDNAVNDMAEEATDNTADNTEVNETANAA